MKRDFYYLSIITLLLAVIWYNAADSEAPEEATSEVVRTDTTTFFRPDPITLDYRTARVEVPRWLFSVSENPTGLADDREGNFPMTAEGSFPDSLQCAEIALSVETRIYRDSTYEAQVSGPAIGTLRPNLDYIRTFSTTREITKTISVIPRKWWELRATAGAFYTPTHSDLWAGIEADRHVGRWSYGASVGYALSGSPYAEVRAGFRILRKTQTN